MPWLVTLACLISGCSDLEPDGEMCVDEAVHGNGNEIEFWFVGLQVEDICPSSFDAAESHAKWVASNWGADPQPIRYAVFESRDDPCWACPAGAVACGLDGRLSSTVVPDRHELAHAARGANCSSFLEEGWATLYSNPFENGLVTVTLSETMDAVQDQGRLPVEYYSLAARFVAFVLETRGLEALRALCEMSMTSASELDVALRQVLGSSLDEVQLEFDMYPMWSAAELRQDQACESTDVLSIPASWTLDLGCTVGGAEGMRAGKVWNHILVELTEDRPHMFEFDAVQDLEVDIELRSCERDGLASIYYQTAIVRPKPGQPSELLLYDLPTGVYVLRLMVRNTQDLGSDLSIGMSITAWP